MQADLKPTTKILGALARQLASPDGESIAEEVKIKYEALNNPNGSQLGEADAFELLKSLIASRNKTIIVIDALNEYRRYIKLLELLQQLSISASNLKFFLSSQLVVEVKLYPSVKRVDINSAENGKDMTFFVENEVQKFQKLREGVWTNEMRSDSIATVTAKAGEM